MFKTQNLMKVGVFHRDMSIGRIHRRPGKLPVHPGQISFKQELVRRLKGRYARKP
jgi:hypothetical protein